MRGINIQPGHIARHTPRNAGAQGREAAVVDVAQDLLLFFEPEAQGEFLIKMMNEHGISPLSVYPRRQFGGCTLTKKNAHIMQNPDRLPALREALWMR